MKQFWTATVENELEEEAGRSIMPSNIEIKQKLYNDFDAGLYLADAIEEVDSDEALSPVIKNNEESKMAFGLNSVNNKLDIDTEEE